MLKSLHYLHHSYVSILADQKSIRVVRTVAPEDGGCNCRTIRLWKVNSVEDSEDCTHQNEARSKAVYNEPESNAKNSGTIVISEILFHIRGLLLL